MFFALPPHDLTKTFFSSCLLYPPLCLVIQAISSCWISDEVASHIKTVRNSRSVKRPTERTGHHNRNNGGEDGEADRKHITDETGKVQPNQIHDG